MIRPRPVALVGLFFSFVAAFPGTEPTPAAHGFLLNIPEPTAEPEVKNKARQDSGGYVDSSSFALGAESSIATTTIPASYYTSTVTSLGGASVCGWIDGVYDDSSRVYCDYGYQCVFHTSAADSSYPDAFGCCQNADDPDSCAFVASCYDANDIAATPSLTATSGKLDAFCTASGYDYCQTFIYTDIDFIAYGCGDAAQVDTIFLTAWAETTIDYYDIVTMAYVSGAVADDAFLSAYESITATTPNVAATPGLSSSAIAHSTSASSSPTSNRSSSPSKKSSTNIGAIVGGVVGGVVGLAGVGAAIFMFMLLQKKKQKANPDRSNEVSQPPLGGPGYPPYRSSHQPSSSSHPTSVIIPPQEVEGSSYRQYAEVDGYTAGVKFPSAAAGYTDTKPQEMDSKAFIAELPAQQAERRPLSSDNSRPVTPESSRR